VGALLALGAALSWGTADFVAGLMSRGIPAPIVAIASQVVAIISMGVAVAVMGVAAPPLGLVGIGLATGVSGALSIVAAYVALARGNMARVAPVLALSSAVPAVSGYALGDRPDSLVAIGIVLGVTGVVLISRRGGNAGSRDNQTGTAIGIALLAALGTGGTLVGLDHVAAYEPTWAVLIMRLGGVVTLGLVITSRKERVPLGRREVRPLIAIGILDTLGNALFATATTLSLLTVVGVVASLFPAVTVGLALVVLGEPLSRTQAAGGLATLLGAAMLTIG
jgi:drug/metabolite transporter (DMT)-like permease